MSAVSIILIVHNDAQRVPRAITSLREQTLRDLEIVIVDDASTDDTPRVIADAVAADPRIRALRLPENSGGCSAPRNAGLRAATGDWVMFCDSDDVYERHAAKNLLHAVEAADADLGCGVVERVDIATRRRRRWREELHAPATLAGIMERPELIADTVSVNKIYRRRWLLDAGIAFPEGVLFEDQLFTLEAFAQASRIAVIDQTVYHWYVDRLGNELSITQRRHEVRNAEQRIEVNRRIDAYLAEHRLDALAEVKRRKFLSHECYLYLASMLEMDDDQAHAVIDVLQPYVAAQDLGVAATLRPALRVAIAHLLLRDLEGIRSAMRAISWSASIDAPIEQRGDRDLWACEHLSGPPLAGHEMSWWLDVTPYRLRFAGDTRLRYCHRIAEISVQGRRLAVRGSTADILGRLAEVRSAQLVLMQGDAVVAGMPVAFTQGDGRWDWSASGILHGRRRLRDGEGGTLALELTFDGGANLSRLRTARIEVQSGAGVDGARGLRIATGEHGTVQWQTGHFSRSAKVRHGVRARWSRAVAPVHRAWLALVRRIAALLPTAPVAVLASERGIGGQPWALFATDAAGLTVQWLDELPTGSARRAWVLGRARWCIVDADVIAPGELASHTALVLMPEGVPILREGRDAPDWDITPNARRRPRAATVRRWHRVVGPSATFEERLRTSTGYSGPIIHADAITDRLRAGAAPLASLAADPRRVVLYAPQVSMAVDLTAFVDALGDRWVLAVRTPVGEGLHIPAVLQSSVVDVSTEPDVAGLLAAADLLVTDAAPLMGIAVQTDLPVIVHAPDLARLIARDRGAYLDLFQCAPGPITDSTEALIAAVRTILDRGCTVAESDRPQAEALAAQTRAPGSVAEVLQMLRGGA